MEELKHFTPLGYTTFRNQHKHFGILPKDRLQHIYCLGRTGMGKSTLLMNMATDDMRKGHGLCVIDPHGDVAERLVSLVPEHRKEDLVHFDATNLHNPPKLNPFANVAPDERHIVASETVSMFKKLWADSWGPRLEYLLRYSVLTLLGYPGATLLDIVPLLQDKGFRNLVLQFTEDPHLRAFWREEYETYQPSLRATAIMPILNKAGMFAANPVLRNIVRTDEGISMEDAMNTGKIVICNLAKGRIGEDTTAILGNVLMMSIQASAMRRAAIPETERQPFYVFVDEAHSFISDSCAAMLSEIRKFGVGLFLAHQFLEQLPLELRTAVLGNVGTTICFRLSARDAKVFETEFYPVFGAEDFINLPQFHFYIKLLIEGVAGRGFSGVIKKPHIGAI